MGMLCLFLEMYSIFTIYYQLFNNIVLYFCQRSTLITHLNLSARSQRTASLLSNQFPFQLKCIFCVDRCVISIDLGKVGNYTVHQSSLLLPYYPLPQPCLPSHEAVLWALFTTWCANSIFFLQKLFLSWGLYVRSRWSAVLCTASSW